MFPMMDTAEEIKELLSKDTFISYEHCAYLGGACNVGKSTLAGILIDRQQQSLYTNYEKDILTVIVLVRFRKICMQCLVVLPFLNGTIVFSFKYISFLPKYIISPSVDF
jgi:hypothetical protein